MLLDARDTATLATSLLQAALRSDKDRVELLLRLGVPLTATNEVLYRILGSIANSMNGMQGGETALYVAASKGDDAIVKMLVLANASLSGYSEQVTPSRLASPSNTACYSLAICRCTSQRTTAKRTLC